jgi:hypothetical protein
MTIAHLSMSLFAYAAAVFMKKPIKSEAIEPLRKNRLILKLLPK